MYEGPSSEGSEIMLLDTSTTEDDILDAIKQPERGFSSSKGLYIHLIMLNEGKGAVEFVYGLLHSQDNLIDSGKIVYFLLLNSLTFIQCQYLSSLINQYISNKILYFLLLNESKFIQSQYLSYDILNQYISNKRD